MDVSVKLCQAVKDGLYDGKSFYRLGTPSGEGGEFHSSGWKIGLTSWDGWNQHSIDEHINLQTEDGSVAITNVKLLLLGGQGDKHVVVFLRKNMFKLLRHSYIIYIYHPWRLFFGILSNQVVGNSPIMDGIRYSQPVLTSKPAISCWRWGSDFVIQCGLHPQKAPSILAILPFKCGGMDSLYESGVGSCTVW